MTDQRGMLSSVPLFKDLPAKTLDRLARITVQRSFPAGTEIVTEGDVGAGFFLITDGTVEIVQGQADMPLRTMKKGEFFGDMALLDGRPRSATVRAAETTSCLVMSRWDFVAEVKSSPDLAMDLLEVMSVRLREMEQRLQDCEKRSGG